MAENKDEILEALNEEASVETSDTLDSMWDIDETGLDDALGLGKAEADPILEHDNKQQEAKSETKEEVTDKVTENTEEKKKLQRKLSLVKTLLKKKKKLRRKKKKKLLKKRLQKTKMRMNSLFLLKC